MLTYYVIIGLAGKPCFIKFSEVFLVLFFFFGCIQSSLPHPDFSMQCAGSVVAEQRLGAPRHVRSQLPHQGSTWCTLHQKADSQPLDHWGSPLMSLSSILLGNCARGNPPWV